MDGGVALLGGLAVVTLLGLRRRRRRRTRRPVPTMEQARARIAEMTAVGMTSQEIADGFNAERIPTLFGRGTWHPASVDLATRLSTGPSGSRPRSPHPSFEESGTFLPLSPVGLREPNPNLEPEPSPSHPSRRDRPAPGPSLRCHGVRDRLVPRGGPRRLRAATDGRARRPLGAVPLDVLRVGRGRRSAGEPARRPARSRSPEGEAGSRGMAPGGPRRALVQSPRRATRQGAGPRHGGWEWWLSCGRTRRRKPACQVARR